MKLIAIGDIHGRNIWKRIVSKEYDADKIIFIGDYFDTKDDISGDQQIQNFKEMVGFKTKYPEKFVLLIGNHDFHYLKSTKDRYSGYQDNYADAISHLLHNVMKKSLMQMCFIHDNLLFVHAGLTKTWCRANKIDLNDLENAINTLFKKNPNAFEFTKGKAHNLFGDEKCQTPIWVRPKSLKEDKIDKFIQIIGHTQVPFVKVSDGLIIIDALSTVDEYLSVTDGLVNVERLTH